MPKWVQKPIIILCGLLYFLPLSSQAQLFPSFSSTPSASSSMPGVRHIMSPDEFAKTVNSFNQQTQTQLQQKTQDTLSKQQATSAANKPATTTPSTPASTPNTPPPTSIRTELLRPPLRHPLDRLLQCLALLPVRRSTALAQRLRHPALLHNLFIMVLAAALRPHPPLTLRPHPRPLAAQVDGI